MTTAAQLGLTQNQYNNVLGIIIAVKARGWPIKPAYIGTAAELDESGARILASANVPKSQQYPHDLISWEPDGLGHDHASCGPLQQQTGYAYTPAGYGSAMNQTTMDSPNGWGTPAELMNATTAAAKFLDALARVPWQSMTNWAAAQAVQGSAFADGSNYRAQDARAQQLVNALWSAEEDDDMSDLARPIVAHDGAKPPQWWLIAADGTSRLAISAAFASGLLKTGRYQGNPGITQTDLVHIPKVTA